MGLILGGFPGELPKKFSGEKIAFAAQQLYTKSRFRCVVVKEKKSVQNLGGKKKKKRKKKRNKPHRSQKWVSWDERVS